MRATKLLSSTQRPSLLTFVPIYGTCTCICTNFSVSCLSFFARRSLERGKRGLPLVGVVIVVWLVSGLGPIKEETLGADRQVG